MSKSKETSIKLSDQDVRQLAQERLGDMGLLSETEGYACDRAMLLDIILKAAVSKQSIETVCNDLATTVSGETVRHYLNEQLTSDDFSELELQSNEALVKELPRRLWKVPLELAIDWHDEPFYGHSPELTPYVCGGEAKAGTTRFFRIATAYVIYKGVRVTLALLFVRPEDESSALVTDFLHRISQLDLTIKRLFLDKGFCAIPVLRTLQEHGVPAILACPIRGKKGGTRALCHGRQSYSAQHTFKSQPHGALEVPVTVTRTFTSHKRSRRPERSARWLVFVVLNAKLDPTAVRRLYGQRFGIESSYRCARLAKAHTTSRNPLLRFWLLALAFLLVNLWVVLRFRFAHCKRLHGPHRFDPKRFQLQRFLNFIARAIEDCYDSISFITSDVLHA